MSKIRVVSSLPVRLLMSCFLMATLGFFCSEVEEAEEAEEAEEEEAKEVFVFEFILNQRIRISWLI